MAATGITLRCSECKSENYRKRKNKTKHVEKIAFKKYCLRCQAHKLHIEKK